MKSEPSEFSIDDFKKSKTSPWEGVRNYQARNFMTQKMARGDRVLFYHSSCEEPGVYGIAEVSKLNVTDTLQFNKKSDYYDPKSKQDAPTWMCVEVKLIEPLKTPVLLSAIREEAKLKEMLLLRGGMRLSIQPVDETHFDYILKMAKK